MDERTNKRTKQNQTNEKENGKHEVGLRLQRTLLRSKRVQNHQNRSYAALFLATSKFAVLGHGISKSIRKGDYINKFLHHFSFLNGIGIEVGMT